MMKTLILRMTAAALLVMVLIGCSGTGSYHDPEMDFGAVQTVALLPFVNLTREASASERVRDTMANMLLESGAVYVIPTGEVARGIARTGMADPTNPSVDEVKKLSGLISADAIISGVVREYGEVRSASSISNMIVVSVQMFDKETGLVVWSADASRGGITFNDRLFGGGGKPMHVVTKEAVDELLAQLFN